MRFADVPVDGEFTLAGQRYRKENTLGISRMICNATLLPPGVKANDPKREWLWVYFNLDAQVPFPEHHIAQVLDLLGTSLPLDGGGQWVITAFVQNGPPNCEIRYQVQCTTDGEGDNTDWYTARELQRLGIEVSFLEPEDTRPDWMKNMAERDYDPAKERAVTAVAVCEDSDPEEEPPAELLECGAKGECACAEADFVDIETNGRKKIAGRPRSKPYAEVKPKSPGKRGRKPKHA